MNTVADTICTGISSATDNSRGQLCPLSATNAELGAALQPEKTMSMLRPGTGPGNDSGNDQHSATEVRQRHPRFGANLVALGVLGFMCSQAASVAAECPDGGHAGGNCKTEDGRRGRITCDGECAPIEPLRDPSGSVYPKYVVLAVVYSPPGSAMGGSSSVTYSSGSTVGTSLSASESFGNATSIGVKASGGILASASASGSYTFGSSDANSTEVSLSKTKNTVYSAVGPSEDGINHAYDRFLLWMRPVISASVGAEKSVSWGIQANQDVDVQWVTLGDLENPSSMPSDVADRLAAYDIGEGDFGEIMKLNPFANGGTISESARFQPVEMTFPYDPPRSPTDMPVSIGETMTTVNTGSHTATHSETYSAGVSFETSTKFGNWFNATLSASSTWTWTYTNATTESESTTQSAALNVTSPSYGYTGPVAWRVYFDSMFKTFAFVPLTGRVGNLTGQSSLLVPSSSDNLLAQSFDLRGLLARSVAPTPSAADRWVFDLPGTQPVKM